MTCVNGMGASTKLHAQRLVFKIKMKLSNLLMERGEYEQVGLLLKEMQELFRNDDGSDDQNKGTQLLEIYALEIQVFTATGNHRKLKVAHHILCDFDR